jgi:hypothetical protein
LTRRIAWAALVVALVALGAEVLGNTTWRRRKAERTIHAHVNDEGRFVDFGVRLLTVEHDPNGQKLIPGKPPLRVLDEETYGGMVDTKADPVHFCGPTRDPVIWLCSRDQRPLILHDDSEPLNTLAYGSMGAGKTQMLAMWTKFRVDEWMGLGAEGGITSPTVKRLTEVKSAIKRLWHPSWYTFKASEETYTVCRDTTVRCVSTHQQSKAAGSPIQGWNWLFAGSDELQDSLAVNGDIEARGRDAPDARYKRMNTVTAKDSSEWRDFVAECKANSIDWRLCKLLGIKSPFIAASYWERLRRTMDRREYIRKVLAEDVGAENALYFGWDRNRNLVRLPRNAVDVTEAVLSQYQSYTRPSARFGALVGHDPGALFNTSVILKCYLIQDCPVWVVVGEVQTKSTTPGQHAAELRTFLRRRFEIEEEYGLKAAVFPDPHGKGESQTDYQTVYSAFQKEGLDVFSPGGIRGRIQRKARVTMVNRLLWGVDERVRLAVLQTADGRPVAPELVKSIEVLETEDVRKGVVGDPTHAPAALGYALYPFEQEAVTEHTQQLALRARRGR